MVTFINISVTYAYNLVQSQIIRYPAVTMASVLLIDRQHCRYDGFSTDFVMISCGRTPFVITAAANMHKSAGFFYAEFRRTGLNYLEFFIFKGINSFSPASFIRTIYFFFNRSFSIVSSIICFLYDSKLPPSSGKSSAKRLSALARPAMPLLSYCLIHRLNDDTATLCDSQNSCIGISFCRNSKISASF